MRRTAVAIVLVLMSGAAHALIIQNLASNPGFDTGTSSWTLKASNSEASIAWQSRDAIGSGRSGSLRVSMTGSAHTSLIAATQCLASVPPGGATESLSLHLRQHNLPSGTLVAFLYFLSGPSCSGSTVSTITVYADATPDNVWVSLQNTGVVPATFSSVFLELLSASLSGAPNTLEFDDVYFGPAAPATCSAGSGTLCLNDAPGDARFRVFGTYSTAQGGGSTGGLHAIDLSGLGVAHGGLMWFFAADNPELLIKVLNACTLNQRYWVFVSAGTNVNVELYVGDTHSGNVDYYHNPDTSAFPAVQNLYALPCS